MSSVISEAQRQLPLPEYAGLVGLFAGAIGSFLALGRHRLPERFGFGDMALVGLASYKLGRLVAKDDVTSFMRAPVTRDEETQEPEREGLARALGELVTCPHCIGVWTSAGLSASLVLFPRETRFRGRDLREPGGRRLPERRLRPAAPGLERPGAVRGAGPARNTPGSDPTCPKRPVPGVRPRDLATKDGARRASPAGGARHADGAGHSATRSATSDVARGRTPRHVRTGRAQASGTQAAAVQGSDPWTGPEDTGRARNPRPGTAFRKDVASWLH